MTPRLFALLALLFFVSLAPSPRASEATPPPVGPEVDVVEHLGERLPLDLSVTDERGNRRRLGDYFTKGRPVIFSLVYYECPTLCALVSRGLVRAMRAVDLSLGRDYDAITLSFDPADTVEAASAKRRGYLEALDRESSDPVWPFLTADAPTIRDLTDALGFRYSPVPGSRDLAHAAVVFVLSPDGTISRYLYGVDFPIRDMRLALVEASAGKVGTSFDRILLRCYRYDPESRRYALFITSYLRTGGALILLGFVALSYRLWKRDRRAQSQAVEPAK